MEETFTVVFAMYRHFFEDPQVRETIIRGTWLNALSDFGGTPTENSQVVVTKAVKFLGPFPVPDDEGLWDRIRLHVSGKATRGNESEERHTPSMPLDDALSALAYSMQQYLADVHATPDSCPCQFCVNSYSDDDDLEEHAPARAYLDRPHVPQREDDEGEDEDADKYPWTNPATWYPEYADE